MRKLLVVVCTALLAPLFFVQTASAAAPGAIFSCGPSHEGHNDPIVYPDLEGVSHLHEFVGNTITDAHTDTTAELLAGGTTCVVKGDKTAFWMPALYEDGNLVRPSGPKAVLFYYRQKAASGHLVQPFPENLKIVIGNAKATQPSELGQMITFKCGPGSNTETRFPPAQCGSGVMVVVSILPNCWDGVNPDPGNNIDQLRYPVSGHCPVGFPVVLPRVQIFARFNVGTDPIDVTFAGTAPDGTFTSDMPYYTAHMDYFPAFDPATMQGLLDKCINAGVDCGKNPTFL